jgi:hypothetical protein
MLAGRLALALVVVAVSLGGRMASAQTAPVTYWVPGFMGLSDDSATGFDAYGNFPSFDGSRSKESGFFSRRYSSASNWANLSGTGLNLQGIDPYGSFGSLRTEGSQFGYRFKSGVALYGGFDTLKYDRGGSNAFAAFDSNASTLPVYSMHGGVEFQPTANTTLSLGFSYTQQGSDRLDSDIRSPALPGETPAAFTSGRR